MWLERLLQDWKTPDLGDWRSWLDHPDDLLLIAAGVVMLAMMLGWALRPRQAPRSKNADKDDEPIRATNTPLFRRLRWRIRPPRDLMVVDGLMLDRDRRPHAAWLGPTGAGKSASVATVRLNRQRPAMVVTPDLSDPMIAGVARLEGFRWTAGVSTTPINFLIGTPQEVAERLTEVFRSGGVGAWKRAARKMTAEVIRQLDAERKPRSLETIGQRLEAAVKSDRELRTVCAGWVARFLDLADQFGPSIGPDGVDLADLLNSGVSVLLDNDAFDRPSLGGDVVALGLAEAKRCASLVPHGFRLIFEEAGQLGERIDLADPLFRAGRRRGIAVDVLTQAESDLTEGISANVATRIYFAQDLKSLQKLAADRLGLDYRDLDPATMKDFSAWISHGRIRRLVRFPKPANLPPSYATGPTQTQHEEPTGRWTIEELAPRPFMPYGVLPPPTAQDALERQLEKTETCHLWTGKLDRDGYGIIHLNGNWRRVHRVRYERAYGPIPLDDNGKPLELDHQCRVRRCARLEHLEPVTKAENIRRRWKVRGKGGATA